MNRAEMVDVEGSYDLTIPSCRKNAQILWWDERKAKRIAERKIGETNFGLQKMTAHRKKVCAHTTEQERRITIGTMLVVRDPPEKEDSGPGRRWPAGG